MGRKRKKDKKKRRARRYESGEVRHYKVPVKVTGIVYVEVDAQSASEAVASAKSDLAHEVDTENECYHHMRIKSIESVDSDNVEVFHPSEWLATDPETEVLADISRGSNG